MDEVRRHASRRLQQHARDTAGTGRDFPLTQFKPDANSPGLSGETMVQSAEGSLKFPVNAGMSKADSLAKAAMTGAQDGAKAATDAATRP